VASKKCSQQQRGRNGTLIVNSSQCKPNPIPTPFIMASEMQNMEHVCIFMTGNDFDINSYGRNGKGAYAKKDGRSRLLFPS